MRKRLARERLAHTRLAHTRLAHTRLTRTRLTRERLARERLAHTSHEFVRYFLDNTYTYGRPQQNCSAHTVTCRTHTAAPILRNATTDHGIHPHGENTCLPLNITGYGSSDSLIRFLISGVMRFTGRTHTMGTTSPDHAHTHMFVVCVFMCV